MENTSDAFAKFATTLEKYRKNKTLVPPEDLAGKYKVPFEKLKTQLKAEMETYLKEYSLDGLHVKKDNEGYFEAFVKAVNRIFSDIDMRRQIGKAAYEEYNLNKVKQLAEQLRSRVYTEAYAPYLQNYTCLYATEACFNEDNPQSPRIYNSLVDKFWDERTGKWISDKEAGAPVAMIYYQRGAKTT